MDNPPTDAAAFLTIDLDALRSNIETLQRAAPGAKLAGVVKADAYGTGMAAAAGIHLACGTETFFVATPDEGVALRAVTGPGPEIAVLSGWLPGAAAELRSHHLTPVINSLADIDAVSEGAAMLQIDTGMRRLGLDETEAAKLVADPAMLKEVNLTAILSHFACADENKHPLTAEQYRRFAAFTAHFPGIRRSLSNSAGIFASPDYHFDMVRPGMAVYGLNPAPWRPNPMRPVVSLAVRILQVRDVAAGDSVGYGAAWRAGKKRRIATVALGYADGFPRAAGPEAGKMFFRGQSCPLAGRVSMDLVTIDVSDVGGPAPETGDWVEVIGPNQDADALAASCGTIGYEILTRLGHRYRRVYRGGTGKSFEIKAVSG